MRKLDAVEGFLSSGVRVDVFGTRTVRGRPDCRLVAANVEVLQARGMTETSKADCELLLSLPLSAARSLIDLAAEGGTLSLALVSAR